MEPHKTLLKSGKTLALAESCTGGALAARFTANAGASEYFLGSIVVYSNDFKKTFLHVDPHTLSTYGAVSREVAHEMILGLFALTDCDYTVATTGVAGPSGGTREKPVGTVYIGIGKRGEKPRITEHHFEGSRQEVIDATCAEALEGCRNCLADAR